MTFFEVKKQGIGFEVNDLAVVVDVAGRSKKKGDGWIQQLRVSDSSGSIACCVAVQEYILIVRTNEMLIRAAVLQTCRMPRSIANELCLDVSDCEIPPGCEPPELSGEVRDSNE